MPVRRSKSNPDPDALRIGLIADTHDLLRPEARQFLAGCDRIIHGGDICNRATLDALADIAPVTAVRGNNDKDEWANGLPEFATLRIGSLRIHVIHSLGQLALGPQDGDIDAVITGHSHRPAIERRDGVLFINPGSAGPRRFRLPVAAGEILVSGGMLEVRIVDLMSGAVLANHLKDVS